MQPQPVCPDCRKPMEVGFLVEFIGRTSRADITYWHPGLHLKKATLLGLIKTGYQVQMNSEAVLPVVNYRCSDCGLLRGYALKSLEGIVQVEE